MLITLLAAILLSLGLGVSVYLELKDTPDLKVPVFLHKYKYSGRIGRRHLSGRYSLMIRVSDD